MLHTDNERAVASYQIAAPTLMIVYSLLLALGNNLMPMVTTMTQRGEHGALARGLSMAYENVLLIVLPGLALMAAFGDIVMTTLFGRDVLDAHLAFAILSAGVVFTFISFLNLHALTGLGQTRAAAIAVLATLAGNFILNLVLISLFNLAGAACATVLTSVICAALTGRALRETLTTEISWWRFSVAVIVAVVLGGVGYACRGWVTSYEQPLIGAIAFSAVVYATTAGALEYAGVSGIRRLSAIMGGINGHGRN